ncbi:MAG: STAS domain-containing protein [Desulfopila sp.]|jgi:anti-anti-sigma factor|nr:STAS domain-containing protein [Desulfopila sp.]
MMEYTLKIESSEAGMSGVLSLTGDVTMVSALETRKALLEAITEVDILRLDLEGVSSADISFLQILCAAHRECFLQGKEIFLEEGNRGNVEDLLERSGYSRQLGCIVEARKSCLWCTVPGSIDASH